jgi:hypothetical protein
MVLLNEYLCSDSFSEENKKGSPSLPFQANAFLGKIENSTDNKFLVLQFLRLSWDVIV